MRAAKNLLTRFWIEEAGGPAKLPPRRRVA
jgi:hypothetical protein